MTGQNRGHTLRYFIDQDTEAGRAVNAIADRMVNLYDHGKKAAAFQLKSALEEGRESSFKAHKLYLAALTADFEATQRTGLNKLFDLMTRSEFDALDPVARADFIRAGGILFEP